MEIDRPLPQPMTPEAKPYWDGLREQKLMLPQVPRVPTAPSSTRACSARTATPATSSGSRRAAAGKLYSFEIGYQPFNKAFKVQAALRARDDRARGGAAPAVESHRRRARSEEDPLRHAGGGRLREADRRDHAAAVPAAAEGCANERAPERGLHRRRGRERRDRHAAAQEPAHAARRGGHGTRCATPASRSATSTASSPPASTRPPPSARRSASCRATSTAPPSAAARSSSWSATRWLRCTMGSATSP